MEIIQIKDIKSSMKNINVVFIVLEVGVATLTKDNREVRTFKAADATACINVSVWDEPGKLLVPGDIVRLTKGYASIWRACLTLYSGKNGEILKMGDFCLAFNESINMSEPNIQAPAVMNNGTSPVIIPTPPVTTTSSNTSTNNTNSTKSSKQLAGNGNNDKPKGSRTGRSSKK